MGALLLYLLLVRKLTICDPAQCLTWTHLILQCLKLHHRFLLLHFLPLHIHLFRSLFYFQQVDLTCRIRIFHQVRLYIFKFFRVGKECNYAIICWSFFALILFFLAGNSYEDAVIRLTYFANSLTDNVCNCCSLR